jgi:hypothetical protein
MDDEIRKALSVMFTINKGLFTAKGPYLRQGTVSGRKIGVVIGSKGPAFSNYALGKQGYDRVVAAKQKGIIDLAVVVFADGDNAVDFTFVSAYDALELQPRLESMPTRTSAFGEFWLLTPAWVRGDFDGGDAW